MILAVRVAYEPATYRNEYVQARVVTQTQTTRFNWWQFRAALRLLRQARQVPGVTKAWLEVW